MHSLLLSTVSGNSIALVAIIGSFAIPILIVGTVLFYKHRREQMWHETARLALEKGQPIPAYVSRDDEGVAPAAGAEADAGWQGWQSRCLWKDLRRGLILLAIGIALFVSGHSKASFGGDSDTVFAGASTGSYILIGLGTAFLISALLRALFTGRNANSTSRPPQA